MSGQGHHIRRKKKARRHFDRQKNERSLQQSKREHPDSSRVETTQDKKNREHPESSSEMALPKHWQKLSSNQYCKVQEGTGGLGEVKASLTLITCPWDMVFFV